MKQRGKITRQILFLISGEIADRSLANKVHNLKKKVILIVNLKFQMILVK